MKKKFILGNCYLNNRKWFWNIWPWWPWPWTFDPNINRLHLLPRINALTKFEKVGQGVVELLIGNEKVTDTRTYRYVQSNAIFSSKWDIKIG